jgi:soluble lytic murein transglycosylase-like protein
VIAELILSAQLAAARTFEARDIPSRAVVEAIIEHESQGRARLCKDEANGSSSRGLMQINRPNSRCTAEDNARFAADFDPARNVRHGVWLLAFQSRWHREHDHNTHDVLVHYCGRGKRAHRFAEEIRAMVRRKEQG